MESSLHSVMRYGNNVALTLECGINANQMYVANELYSVTIEKENI